jgi:membrane protein required for colicin V production
MLYCRIGDPEMWIIKSRDARICINVVSKIHRIVDISPVVVAIIVLSAGLAWMRGFVRELLSIGGWIAAGVATLFGLPLARPLANEKIPDPLFADIAAGVVIFVVTLIVCSIIGHFISKRVQGSMLGPVDRSLGLMFGLVRGALVVSALALGIDYFWPPPTLPPPEVANAMTLPMASKGANAQ